MSGTEYIFDLCIFIMYFITIILYILKGFRHLSVKEVFLFFFFSERHTKETVIFLFSSKH